MGRQSKVAAELLRKRCLRQQARLVSIMCKQQYTAVSVFTSSVTSAKACKWSVSPASKALTVCDCVQGPLLSDFLLPLRHVCAHLLSPSQMPLNCCQELPALGCSVPYAAAPIILSSGSGLSCLLVWT